MNEIQSTFGVSKTPQKPVHHVIWYYRYRKNIGLLDRIYCKECNTHYPTSELLTEFHPKDMYDLARHIQHLGKTKK